MSVEESETIVKEYKQFYNWVNGSISVIKVYLICLFYRMNLHRCYFHYLQNVYTFYLIVKIARVIKTPKY